MLGEVTMRDLGTLAEVARHTDLKNKAGVYLMRCISCSKPVYVGKSKELLVRLITHAYLPPYGAVDLIIGEVIRPDRREKWNRLCEHLKAVSSKTRIEVAHALKVEVAVPVNPADIDRIEADLLAANPGVFGDGQRVWGSTHMDNFTAYWVHRAGGNLPDPLKSTKA